MAAANIFSDDTPSTNYNVISDCYARKHNDLGTKPHIVAYMHGLKAISLTIKRDLWVIDPMILGINHHLWSNENMISYRNSSTGMHHGVTINADIIPESQSLGVLDVDQLPNCNPLALFVW